MEYICKYATEHHGINERDHHYLTPLHIAVKYNSTVNVKRLLDFKVYTFRLLQNQHSSSIILPQAELASSDDNGRTALHHAVTQNAAECARVIIDVVV